MKDLYHFVNGPWLATHEIPADRGADGAFYALRDEAEEMVHALVKQDNGRPGALYHSFMDTDGVAAAGIGVLDEDFELLTAADPKELVANFGKLSRTGVASPVGVWTEKDPDSDTVVPYLTQGGLGLPNEAYYSDPAHAQTLAAYQQHVARMLSFVDPTRLFGLGAEVAAARIVALETEIAAGHWDVVAARDAIKTNNPTTVAQLPEIIGHLVRASGLADGRIIARMPDYFEHLATLLTAPRMADWQLWGTWAIIRSRAAYLSEDIARANFEFYGTALSGATEQRDRWKRALSFAEGAVGQDIGKAYVAEHFPPSSKSAMEELVRYLTDAYRERISQLPWMTQDTRTRALEKLELFRAKIGYPDRWRDYGDLEFSSRGQDLMANVRRAELWDTEFHLAKLGKPVDREEWYGYPQTVNAFYHPLLNDITFPAAILRPPFFDPAADPAENFGAIGAVIGHEIGHGFDDQGSQYDGHGNLHSWWSAEDRAAFDKLTAQLVAQFDGQVPSVLRDAQGEDNQSRGVNGAFTLGENIGDLGGLGIAVVAYRNYCAEHGIDPAAELAPFEVSGAAPELYEREYTGFQRLFLAWARVWRTAIRPELAAQYLAIDPHSPAEFRCNLIAANIDEFYAAFPELTEDSPMYLAADQRVTIW